MKKIVSIILALILVLAIAAPAMAITGYVTPITEKTAAVPFELNIGFITSPAAGLEVLNINGIASNKAYVENELVYGCAMITYKPKTTWDKYDTNNTNLVISSDAVSLVSAVAYEVTSTGSNVLLTPGSGGVYEAGSADLNTINNTLTWTVADYKSYIVLFSGVAKGQGAVVAELRGGNTEYFKGVKGELSATHYPIYNDVGEKLYEIWQNGDFIEVQSYIKDATGIVSFEMGGDTYCDDIYVNGEKVQYTVPVSNEGAILESIGTWTAADKTGKFVELKACYENVMNYFGFDYNKKGELLDAHFTSKLHSFYAVDTAIVNFHADAIVTPDADVDIPQTGDVSGFPYVAVVLIVVAIAAGCYVASRRSSVE